MLDQRCSCEWGTLNLSDIMRLGLCLREAAQVSGSLTQRAQLVTQFLYESFISRQSGIPTCPLVRVFRTSLTASLSPDDRRHLVEAYGASETESVSSVVQLIGSYGLQPQWCQSRNSIRYRCMPWGGVYRNQFPMIHEIISRAGYELDGAVSSSTMNDSTMCEDMLYVPDAVGSPYILAQAEFVEPFEIRSVIGLGGRLADGEVFCVVIFSRSAIPAHVLPYMRMLSLNVQLALEWKSVANDCGDRIAVGPRWEACHGVFRELLLRYEDTIVGQHESVRGYVECVRLQQQDIEERAGHVQALNRQLLTAAEDERRRLARNLHDVVATQLGGMVFQMQAVLDVPPQTAVDALFWIHRYRTALVEIVKQTRTLAFELHPLSLGEAGAAVAIERVLSEVGQRQGWRTSAQCDSAVERVLTYEESLCLYRVAQEAIHNCEKHAKATCVCVELTGQGDQFVLEISDNGRGFQPRGRSGRVGEVGLGLLGMEERARLINGNLVVQSSQTDGTRVRLTIPRGGR